MNPTTAAGSALAVSATLPSNEDAAGFGAVPFVEVGHVEKIGTFGATYQKTEFQPLRGAKLKLKGAAEFGALTPTLALNDNDAGQALLRVASDDATDRLFAFRVSLPDGAQRWFLGKVFGMPETADVADAVITANPVIEICSKPVRGSPAIDTVPDDFAFSPKAVATLDTDIVSDPVMITGINSPASIAGGPYSINGGAFTTAAGTVNAGDFVRALAHSSTQTSVEVSTAVTIGGITRTFKVTTAESQVPIPQPIMGVFSAPEVEPSANPAAYPPSIASLALHADHLKSCTIQVIAASDSLGASVLNSTTIAIGNNTVAQLLAAVNSALSGFNITAGTGFIFLRVDKGPQLGTLSIPVQYGTAAVPTITSSKAVQNYEGSKLAAAIVYSAPVRDVLIVDQDQDQFEIIGPRPGAAFVLRWTGDKTQTFFHNNSFDYSGIYKIGLVATGLNGKQGAPEAFTVELLDLDETPAAFAFTASTGQARSTVIESNIVEITDISPGIELTGSANGDEFRRRRAGVWGPYGTAPQTFIQGDGAQMRKQTPAGYSSSTLATFTLAAVDYVWNIQTLADPAQPAVSLISDVAFADRGSVGSDSVPLALPAGRVLLYTFVDGNAQINDAGQGGHPYTIMVAGVAYTNPAIRATDSGGNYSQALWDIVVPAGGVASFQINGGQYRGSGHAAVFQLQGVGAITGAVKMTPTGYTSGVLTTPALDIPTLGFWMSAADISGVTFSGQNGEVLTGSFPNSQYSKTYFGTKPATADGPIAVNWLNANGDPAGSYNSLFGVAFGAP